MIKHIVMWRLKDTAHGKSAAENAQHIKMILEDLNGKILGLLRLEVGIDFSKETDSCDLVLFSEFDSKAALKAYADHPAHKAVMPYIADARSGRFVVDYETEM